MSSRCTTTRRSPSPEPAGSVVTTDSPAVLVERDGDIVTITLDRPEKRNALAVDVMRAVTAAVAAARATPTPCGIVIAARGPGVLRRAQLRRHGRRLVRGGAAGLRRLHGDDDDDPVDAAAGVRQGARPGDRRRAASSSPAATSPSPPSRPASPFRAARAGCSATRRSSPWPARSDASGRWRWRSPAIRSTPPPPPTGVWSTGSCPTPSSTPPSPI